MVRKLDLDFFKLAGIVIFIEGFLFYIQQRLTFEFAPLRLSSTNKPLLLKYVLEYGFMRLILSAPVWLLAKMKIPNLLKLKKVAVFNLFFFCLVFLLSVLFFPMSLLQLGIFKIQDVVYFKLSHLLLLLFVSSLVTPVITKAILKSA